VLGAGPQSCGGKAAVEEEEGAAGKTAKRFWSFAVLVVMALAMVENLPLAEIASNGFKRPSTRRAKPENFPRRAANFVCGSCSLSVQIGDGN